MPPRRLSHRFFAVLVLAIFACAPSLAHALGQGRQLPATGTIEVAFTPEDNATRLITQALRNARQSVRVLTFSFTSNEIAFALIEAKRRGVSVEVIADAEQAVKLENSRIPLLAEAGLPVWLDDQHNAAHNKVMVIDADLPSCIVITGSMNFTYAAQFKNAENLLVLRGNPPLCAAYAENWQHHRRHSRSFRP
jgi:phosphatidylserine/phosphatidylglycerophosphate/cardiolipin synthase-like enzyme